jgi:hypothetical protein
MLTLGAAALGGGPARAADPPAGADKPRVFACPPCGCPNDGKEFPAARLCSACGMPLVEKVATPPEKPKSEQPPRPEPAKPS